MPEDDFDWFEPDDEEALAGRSGADRRWVRVLRERSRSWNALGVLPNWTQVWTDRAYVFAHLDLVDHERGGIVGVLRVDFDGEHVRAGWDTTGQLVGELGPDGRDATVSPLMESPERAAAWAADWLEAQLRRPLERRERRQGDQVVYQQWD